MRIKLLQLATLAIYITAVEINFDVLNIYLLLSLFMLDSIFGVIRAYRFGKKIKLSALVWGYTIKLIILCVPFVLAILVVMAKQWGSDQIIDKSILVYGLSEVISIIGNAYSIKTKKDLPKFDLIGLLLKSLRGRLISLGQITLKKIENSKDCGYKDREEDF